MARVDAEAWQGPRESTRMPEGAPRGERGGWHFKGPRVSGPWLGVWGDNANALCRPTFYTHPFSFFLPCGTIFPGDFKCAGDVAEYIALDANALN